MKRFVFNRAAAEETVYYNYTFEVEAETEEEALELLEDDAFLYETYRDAYVFNNFEWKNNFELKEERETNG